MANNFYKSIDEAFDRFEVGHAGHKRMFIKTSLTVFEYMYM